METKLKKELTLLKTESGKERRFITAEKTEYPTLFQLYISVKLIYASSIKCESTFSKMKNVKLENRSKMSDETLDSILRINYTKTNEVNDVIDKMLGIERKFKLVLK